MPKHDEHYKENNKDFPFSTELQLQLQSFDDKPFTNIYLFIGLHDLASSYRRLFLSTQAKR